MARLRLENGHNNGLERRHQKRSILSLSGKLMVSVCWNCEGVMFIEYLEKGKTIAEETCCALLLGRLRTVYDETTKGFFNLQCTSSAVVLAKLMKLRFQLIPHPPSSPDLASSNHFLFLKIKNGWQKRIHSWKRGCIRWNEYLFTRLEQSYYLDGTNKLK